MCGIAGVLRIHDPKDGTPPPHHQAIPDAWLDILDESIQHRGPDGAGRFRDRANRPDGTVVDVALVHRRLAIIDPACGAQPMVHVRQPGGAGEILPIPGAGTLDATTLPPGADLIAVAFNGCIYNHRELRAELEACGHVFQTDHSDTEVLLHGWREWGLSMQGQLDGMYAWLIWDRRTGQFVWGRDLAGEKPLYWYGDPPTFLISSALPGAGRTAVLRHAQAFEPNRWISAWLSHGAFLMPPADSTDLPARTTESIDIRDPAIPLHEWLAQRKQHRLRTALPQRSQDNRSRLDRELIERAVTSRLEADVPLGVFLSGGIDSALIAVIAKQQRPDIQAFTVRMPETKGGPRYDESEAAAETAAAIGVEHHILDCEPNPADDLVMLIEQLGLPFGDSSLLPTYWVCKAAREHVKVALSGDGGDELFGGYRRHTINSTLNRWRRLLRLIPDRLLDQRRPGSRQTYLARLAVAARCGGYLELLSIFPTPDLRRLVSIDGQEPIGENNFRPVDDPLRDDFRLNLPDDLLRKTDAASMAVALEVRCPFLAKDLVDAAMRTPLNILMPPNRNGPQRKGLLKQIARTYLPDHVVDRPKQGFAIPIGDWFRTDYGGLRQLLHDHLGPAIAARDPDRAFPGLADVGVLLNLRFVEQMLREHDAAGEQSPNPWRGRDHSQRLYMLLVLSVWSRWLARLRERSPAGGCEGAATPA